MTVRLVRLEIVGPDSRLLSDLCAECPQGPTGCCKAPPEADWSDIGRIVSRGGRDFLLAQIAARNLLPSRRGLDVRRVRKRESPTEPMTRKCVFHGKGGCTIDHLKRPATCNYFLCEDAFVEGSKDENGLPLRASTQAREAHAALRALYEAWDEELSKRIAEAYPEGVTYDAAFLDWLGLAFEALERRGGDPLSDRGTR